MTVPTRSPEGQTSVAVLGELAPLPRSRASISYAGPGIGEIKPHDARHLREGLEQLRRYAATRPRGTDAVLLTYAYTPGRKKLKVFALRPSPSVLAQGPPRYPGATGAREWIEKLGTWYSVKDADLPSHPFAGWLASLGPTGRGTAFEPAVRQAFIETIKPRGHDTASKWPSAAGADVVWREVAEYLHELVGELAGRG